MAQGENTVSIKKHVKVTGTITLENGETKEVERIGKGRFSTAWCNCEHVYLQTREADYGKEMVKHLAGQNKHIPLVEYIGDDYGRVWYRSPLYRKLTASEKEAWRQFKALKELWEQSRSHGRASIKYGQGNQQTRNEAYCMAHNARFAELVQDATYLPDSLKQAIDLLLGTMADYGASWTIEVVARNSAVDSDGNLILLDYVFDTNLIKR